MSKEPHDGAFIYMDGHTMYLRYVYNGEVGGVRLTGLVQTAAEDWWASRGSDPKDIVISLDDLIDAIKSYRKEVKDEMRSL